MINWNEAIESVCGVVIMVTVIIVSYKMLRD